MPGPYGSKSNPYVEFPFDRIISVHWGGLFGVLTLTFPAVSVTQGGQTRVVLLNDITLDAGYSLPPAPDGGPSGGGPYHEGDPIPRADWKGFNYYEPELVDQFANAGEVRRVILIDFAQLAKDFGNAIYIEPGFHSTMVGMIQGWINLPFGSYDNQYRLQFYNSADNFFVGPNFTVIAQIPGDPPVPIRPSYDATRTIAWNFPNPEFPATPGSAQTVGYFDKTGWLDEPPPLWSGHLLNEVSA